MARAADRSPRRRRATHDDHHKRLHNRRHPPPPGCLRSRWLLVLYALLALGAAWRAGAAAGDPPGRVARIGEVDGQVWLYSPDSGEWIAIERNRPLTTGDRIATDNGGRAEIELGSTTLRLDARTELEIERLDDTHFPRAPPWRQRRARGFAARSRSPSSGSKPTKGGFASRRSVATGSIASTQGSDLTVYSGQAVYERGNTALPFTTGQHAQFWLDARRAAVRHDEPARDDFAAWNDERDRAENRPVAAVRYVSPEMTGADDLDRYGQWEQTPDYGAALDPGRSRPTGRRTAPAIGPGCGPGAGPGSTTRPGASRRSTTAAGSIATAGAGRPALTSRGRSMRRRWWPGSAARGSACRSRSAAAAPVGWFPLAPREVYVPSYRSSPRYVREINITHVSNVASITTIVNNVNGAADRREFANRRYPNAVTVVPAERADGPPAGRRRRGAFRARSAGARPRRRSPARAGDERRARGDATGAAARAAGSGAGAAAVPGRAHRAGSAGVPATKRVPRSIGSAHGAVASATARPSGVPAANLPRSVRPSGAGDRAAAGRPNGRAAARGRSAAGPRDARRDRAPADARPHPARAGQRRRASRRSRPRVLRNAPRPRRRRLRARSRARVVPRGERRRAGSVTRVAPSRARGAPAGRAVEAVRPVEAPRPEPAQRVVEPNRGARPSGPQASPKRRAVAKKGATTSATEKRETRKEQPK